MKTLKFKCTLLSDLIINQKAATEGNQESLDFIPGSNFLGIAAGVLYPDETLSLEEKRIAFHSGEIRFGDAHPANDNLRTLRIPASMYYSKTDFPENGCYIHHRIEDFKALESIQLKQCRTGFYSFSKTKDNQTEGQKINVNKTFAMKSAYDRLNRRSKDEAMYGYQSIDKEQILFFEVCFASADAEKLTECVQKALIGEKRVGRSRTAQYGLVKIEECEYSDFQSTFSDKNLITIYADGRLIFLDEQGLPTFTPTEKNLGFNNNEVEILWNKSQIRTFQYAPWNFIRQARDTDRCGIEKGSVLVILLKNKIEKLPEDKYIGYYKNEGFGKVIYNPSFLDATENGKACCKLLSEPADNIFPSVNKKVITSTDNILLQYLLRQANKESLKQNVYTLVNNFVTNEGKQFPNTFASQWGTIRSIAIQCTTKSELFEELFSKTIERNGKQIPFAYLTHGKGKDKWELKNRVGIFKSFFIGLTEENAIAVIINLAAEMAKQCRREK